MDSHGPRALGQNRAFSPGPGGQPRRQLLPQLAIPGARIDPAVPDQPIRSLTAETEAPQASATSRDRSRRTRWLHAEPAGRGAQRARAVTTGVKEPQVRPPTPPPSGTTSDGRVRVRVSHPAAMRPPALPTRRWITEDGPHPPAELGGVGSRCELRRSHRRGHPRASGAVASGMSRIESLPWKGIPPSCRRVTPQRSVTVRNA